MIDLLFLPDLKVIETAQKNETDMIFKVETMSHLNVVLNALLTNCINTVQENN